VSSREEYLEQMESQLNVWRTQLAQISSKSENLNEVKRDQIKKEFGNLQVQIREFQDRMGVMSDANAEAWEKLKAEAEEIRLEVGQAIGKVASAVNEMF
jgi:hypothetical protein